MGFLNDAGVTTLWSRIKNYMTGNNVKTLAIDNATNVDEALTALNTELTAQKATDNAFESGLAVVADGDTHAAIINGQYVYIKNHDSLAEGLYIANDDIDTDEALSGKVTAASGGLNTLVSSFDELNDRISHIYRFKFASGNYASGDIIPIVNDFGNDSKIYAENGSIKFAGHYILFLAMNVFSKNTNNRSWISIAGTNTRKQMIAYGEYTNV